MIRFTLRCADDHRFESWFQSSDAFDKLIAAGMVNCAICGSTQVEKALMSPKIRAPKIRAADNRDSKTQGDAPHDDAPPSDIARQALAELKRHVEQNSDYVGMNFAREARDIRDGLAPDRSIYGEARPDEARKLIEDGIPVAPLPFVPGRKSN